MKFIFTHLKWFNKTCNSKKQIDVELFIKDILDNNFSPSEQTLKNIKDFADDCLVNSKATKHIKC